MPLATTVIVPARDEQDRLPATLEAITHILHVTRLILVDDGSRDETANIARDAGAEVLRSTPSGSPAGKGKALLIGLGHARTLTTDAILLADADLGPSAAELADLLDALNTSHPASIAAFPPAVDGGLGLVKNFARREIIRRDTLGYVPAEPLSGQRALLRPVLDELPGIAPGFGAEVGMTLDLLSAGITPLDVPLPLSHRPTGRTLSGFVHRARQGLDVLRAIRGARLPW